MQPFEALRVQAEAAATAVPPQFVCPLTLCPMRDPVTLADGSTYERAAITKWLETSDVSPLSNQPLAHKYLHPNLALRQLIEAELNPAG